MIEKIAIESHAKWLDDRKKAVTASWRPASANRADGPRWAA
jgi:hypothetical protein